jgi:lipopolysaccharide/colanic/teichoic acid biosynthesis glycosyltransferase
MEVVKRIIDVLFSIILLIILSPAILIIILLVGLMLGSPVLFRQTRPGYKGKPFVIYKFRSMTAEKDAEGKLLPDAKRLTRFGQFLRNTSLDELPELFNVIKGEMSLVGPRPLLMEYLPLYTPEQARRHEVKPGITGWAQINGRNTLDWDKRFQMDLWYIDHWSLGLDCKILFLTIFKVLRREGINAEGQTAMAKFIGRKEI